MGKIKNFLMVNSKIEIPEAVGVGVT